MINFVHHAGCMQTRSTPSATVLIWSLTNDIAQKAYLGGAFAMAPPLLTLPFGNEGQMVPSDRNTLTSFDGFCSLWLGANLGRWVG